MATSEPDERGSMTLVNSVKHLFVSGEWADVTFVFGGNTSKLHAHTLVLGMRSPVFKAMLYGPLSDESAREINIEDEGPEIFQVFLRYIYTDEIELDGSSVFQILYLACKYSLDILEEKCCAFLKESVTVENVCTIYEQASVFSQHDLQKNCFDFITEHVQAVFTSNTFLSISKETLGSILASDNLLADEKCVFDAAVSWAEHQCNENQAPVSDHNIRQQLADNFYHIRFPLIPMDVFTTHICPREILLIEEKNTLFRYMTISADQQEFRDHQETTDGEEKLEKFTARPRRGTTHVHVLNLTPGPSSTILSAYAPETNETKIKFSTPYFYDLTLRSAVCRDNETRVQKVYTCTRVATPMVVPEYGTGYRIATDYSCLKVDLPFYRMGKILVFPSPLVLKHNATYELTFVHEHKIGFVEYTKQVKIRDYNMRVHCNTNIVQEIRYSL